MQVSEDMRAFLPIELLQIAKLLSSHINVMDTRCSALIHHSVEMRELTDHGRRACSTKQYPRLSSGDKYSLGSRFWDLFI